MCVIYLSSGLRLSCGDLSPAAFVSDVWAAAVLLSLIHSFSEYCFIQSFSSSSCLLLLFPFINFLLLVLFPFCELYFYLFQSFLVFSYFTHFSSTSGLFLLFPFLISPSLASFSELYFYLFVYVPLNSSSHFLFFHISFLILLQFLFSSSTLYKHLSPLLPLSCIISEDRTFHSPSHSVLSFFS